MPFHPTPLLYEWMNEWMNEWVAPQPWQPQAAVNTVPQPK
jgi:hypothetical protein